MSLISPNLASDFGLESKPPPAPAMIMAWADKDDEEDEAVVMEEWLFVLKILLHQVTKGKRENMENQVIFC